MKYYIETACERTEHLYMLLKKSKKEVFRLTEKKCPTCELSSKEETTYIFSPAKKFEKKDVLLLKNNSVVISGNITDETKKLFEAKKIIHKNLLTDMLYSIKNNVLTAEAILALVITHTKRSIFEEKILILGMGNLGTATAKMLTQLGLEVSCVNYTEERYFQAYHFSKIVYLGDEFKKHLKDYSVIINTAPAKLFADEELPLIKKDTVFLETATGTCLSQEKAEHFKYILCPALPSKFMPHSAAELMYEYIKKNA
ncbi:MAG: hypothetical protein FWD89_02720 [Firmicutes bacterium]|nr:hypothetical protein [Bacillota bacterium]